MERTSFGNAMYSLTISVGKFLFKVRPLYYLLNLTWGLLLTIIGWFVALSMMVSGHKPNWYHGVIYFRTKASNWGGFSIGMVFVVCSNAFDSVLEHEYGHTYQNAILGPFMLFLVSIPSMFRYWYQVDQIKKGVKFENDWYNSAWFEGSATDLGSKLIFKKKEEIQNEDK